MLLGFFSGKMKFEDAQTLHDRAQRNAMVVNQLTPLIPELVSVILSFVTEALDPRKALGCPFTFGVSVHQIKKCNVLTRASELPDGRVVLPFSHSLLFLDFERQENTVIPLSDHVLETKVFQGEVHVIVRRGCQRSWQIMGPAPIILFRTRKPNHRLFLVSDSHALCCCSDNNSYLVEARSSSLVLVPFPGKSCSMAEPGAVTCLF